MSKYDNLLGLFEKNQENDLRLAGEAPYYVVRCQKRVLLTQKKWPKILYPNVIEKGACNDANIIHALNMFKISLDKENRYRNHFSLPDDQRELFEDLNDIDLRMSFKSFQPILDYKIIMLQAAGNDFQEDVYVYITKE